ncbi:MAG TPA: response regulator [Verrucomicrobiae bacterium]|nr:response regulator [Verrucomicrobiae bacterium]
MPEPNPAKKKILVVDDEPLVCEAIGMMLSFDGHEVITAGSGKEALDLFDRGGFDLVTTDYTMPEMKGDELARALKVRLPGQPVIMITAHAEMFKNDVVAMSGVDQVVSKPFKLQELRDAIQKATARR